MRRAVQASLIIKMSARCRELHLDSKAKCRCWRVRGEACVSVLAEINFSLTKVSLDVLFSAPCMQTPLCVHNSEHLTPIFNEHDYSLLLLCMLRPRAYAPTTN